MTIQLLDGAGGYVALKEFDNGLVAAIYILSPDCVRLRTEEQEWCYGSEVQAIAALCAWNGAGEPDGWERRILRPSNLGPGPEGAE